MFEPATYSPDETVELGRSQEDGACGHADCNKSLCSIDRCPLLKGIGAVQHLAARDTLFWQDDAAENLYLIRDGIARMCRLSADGRRQINRIAFPGDLIAVTGTERYPYSAEAITPLTVVAFPRATFNRQVDRVSCLRQLVHDTVLKELDAVHDQIMLLGQKTATERVAHILALLARNMNDDPSDPIELPLSRTDIADYLGLTVETVSRTLSRFKREGKIRMLNQRLIMVPDFDRLVDDELDMAC